MTASSCDSASSIDVSGMNVDWKRFLEESDSNTTWSILDNLSTISESLDDEVT